MKVKFTHFPLHPETPEEGAARGPEFRERNQRMKALMNKEGLDYNADRNMSYNSRLAQELAKWAETKGKGDEIQDPLFRAFFVDVRNIAKPEVLAQIAAEVGLPRDDAVEILASRAFKDSVDRDWQRCADYQVTAVPTFLIGRFMMIGAQPYEELEKLVRKASESSSPSRH